MGATSCVMPGLEFIAAGIAEGSIDTVVLAFPDMHGRPVGKRITPTFFTEHVAEYGIDACDYLLADLREVTLCEIGGSVEVVVDDPLYYFGDRWRRKGARRRENRQDNQ